MAAAVAKPPPEWPQMPTRSMSMKGCRSASSLMPAIWSGSVLSPMRPYQASWNAFARPGVPMPSIATTTKPSSASAW